MDEAFVIMQIGNPEMDGVHDVAIAPAISAASLTPRRVDRHNEGDLLKSEIVQFIERSQIIVADLTNERPNCYLEVGYAMGLGKKSNLILTVRSDHHWSSPAFDRDGPRLHFDLEGYDILFWDPDDLETFREELTRRIRRRLAVVANRPSPPPLAADTTWRDELRTRALAGLAGVGRNGYVEVAAEIFPRTSATQGEVLAAMREATISTFGWPIGVVLDGTPDRPRPTVDGIEAEIAITADSSLMDRTSYDFWKAFGDGRFYTLMSLFEDERIENSLAWDTRTVRATEALLLLARLYRRLNASDNDQVSVTFRHGGLQGRALHVLGNRLMTRHPEAHEDVVETSFTTTVSGLETDITTIVRKVVDPLLTMFDFYSVNPEILDTIIEGYVAGEMR
jgi:hypothetical protein